MHEKQAQEKANDLLYNIQISKNIKAMNSYIDKLRAKKILLTQQGPRQKCTALLRQNPYDDNEIT